MAPQSQTKTEKQPLTERQAEVLANIRKFWEANGFSPSIREIAQQHGMTSPNGAKSVLDALAKKGYISRVANISRSIVLINN